MTCSWFVKQMENIKKWKIEESVTEYRTYVEERVKKNFDRFKTKNKNNGDQFFVFNYDERGIIYDKPVYLVFIVIGLSKL